MIRYVVWAVLLTSPVWVVALKRLVGKWIDSHFEKELYVQPERAVAIGRVQAAVRPVLFPLATSCTLIAVVAIVATIGLLLRTDILPIVLFIITTVMFCMLLPILAAAVLYAHHSGGTSRLLKYELALSALGIAIITIIAGNAVVAGMALIRSDAGAAAAWRELFSFVCAAEVLFWLFLLLAQYGTYKAVTAAVRRNRVSILFYYSQARWLWVVGALCSPLLVVIALLRFRLVAALAQQPILYFRSFRSGSVPNVFTQIVAKAARRVGVVKGLVHSTQRASSLQQTLDITEHGRFSVASEEQWRNWVVAELENASAVIVDATHDSDNLRWELGQAVDRVGAARVAVLRTRREPGEELWCCVYSLDRDGIARARRQLQTWLEKTFADAGRMPAA